MEIGTIQARIQLDDYRISEHAIKRMLERAINSGAIIEEYPDDKYAPGCLIYGRTNIRRDLHVQVSLPPKVVIITTYEPDFDEWIDCRVRR